MSWIFLFSVNVWKFFSHSLGFLSDPPASLVGCLVVSTWTGNVSFLLVYSVFAYKALSFCWHRVGTWVLCCDHNLRASGNRHTLRKAAGLILSHSLKLILPLQNIFFEFFLKHAALYFLALIFPFFDIDLGRKSASLSFCLCPSK